MKAHEGKIHAIFNGNRILEIPFFQRSYVWGEEQWKRFMEDMEHISRHAREPYFLGSLILKERKTEIRDNGTDDVWILIDGQQRLTTLIMFFHTMWLRDKERSKPEWDYLKDIFRLRRPPRKLAFCHNHNDRDAFERIINLEQIEDGAKKKTGREKKEGIIGAYEYFEEKIDIGKLNIDGIINNVTFVVVELGDKEDEQQIFDTFNSLGVSLTTADLLKNFFFDKNQIDSYNKNWKEIFERDEETREYWGMEISFGGRRRTFIDLFFYAYLQIKVREPGLEISGKDKGDFLRMESIFESYKRMINTPGHKLNKNDIIEEIKEYASLFRKNFDLEILKNGLSGESGIERINVVIFGLENSTLIPYVLFILKNVAEDVERWNLFDSIETYIMRRIVCKADTKNYNQLFSERMIGHAILSKTDFLEQINKSDDNSVNFLPNDTELPDGFEKSRLINKQAKGILYFIESKIRSDTSTRLKGFSEYSLEHLMPKKWENHWGKVDEPEKRNRMLRTLGNLAIIPGKLNTSLKDSKWKTKLKGRGEKKGLKLCSAGIETLRDCLKVDDWNEDEIRKRAKWLCKRAIKAWPVE